MISEKILTKIIVVKYVIVQFLRQKTCVSTEICCVLLAVNKCYMPFFV